MSWAGLGWAGGKQPDARRVQDGRSRRDLSSCPMGALWLPSPAVALGVSGAIEGEVPGLVVAVVPAGWLGVGVLPGTPVLVRRDPVVSGGVAESSSKVSAGEEALLVPGDVLPNSVVTAGPWLVPSIVPAQVGERRVEVGGGNVLVSTPNEVTARAVLVPTDVKMVVSAQLVVAAVVVGVEGLVVSPNSVGVGSGCAMVLADELGAL